MSGPRVELLDDGKPVDVFEVLELTDGLARVRSPFLFELGEELPVRLEREGKTSDAIARVRAHVGDSDARVTELELEPEPRG
jgi:hypothetical protein